MKQFNSWPLHLDPAKCAIDVFITDRAQGCTIHGTPAELRQPSLLSTPEGAGPATHLHFSALLLQ
jgi:hypothetical protein